MRKSVVFLSILATIFLLGTSNASAGNGPIFFDTCGCDAICFDGVPSALFIADVVYEPFITVVPPAVTVDPVVVTYDGMEVTLTPESDPPEIFPGDTLQFFSDPPVVGLPPGELTIECVGQYSYPNGAIEGIVTLNNGGEFRRFGTCDVPPCFIQVYVDIRPQSCPNPLNVNAKGVLPVAILTTDVFDATTVDPASVRLEGVAPLRWEMEDVTTPFNGPFVEECYDCTNLEGDGAIDLTLKFDHQEIVAAIGPVSGGECIPVDLTGNLMAEYGETPIQGYDMMLVTPSVDGD